CFHGRSRRFLDRCRGMAPKPCGAGTGASLPRRTRRHRSRTLTAPHAAPSIGAMSTYPVRTRRWTRKEYDRLIDLGILREDEPIEVVGGQMIVAEPKSSPHETALGCPGLERPVREELLLECAQLLDVRRRSPARDLDELFVHA